MSETMKAVSKEIAKQQKAKAVEYLRMLDIFKPYIQGFKQSDKVCFFENFGGFWVYQEPEIEADDEEIRDAILEHDKAGGTNYTSSETEVTGWEDDL